MMRIDRSGERARRRDMAERQGTAVGLIVVAIAAVSAVSWFT